MICSALFVGHMCTDVCILVYIHICVQTNNCVIIGVHSDVLNRPRIDKSYHIYV